MKVSSQCFILECGLVTSLPEFSKCGTQSIICSIPSEFSTKTCWLRCSWVGPCSLCDNRLPRHFRYGLNTENYAPWQIASPWILTPPKTLPLLFCGRVCLLHLNLGKPCDLLWLMGGNKSAIGHGSGSRPWEGCEVKETGLILWRMKNHMEKNQSVPADSQCYWQALKQGHLALPLAWSPAKLNHVWVQVRPAQEPLNPTTESWKIISCYGFKSLSMRVVCYSDCSCEIYP